MWDPTTHKVVINRDVIFIEDKEQVQVVGDSTSKENTETTIVQVEEEVETTLEHEVREPTESKSPEVRRSTRTRKPPS